MSPNFSRKITRIDIGGESLFVYGARVTQSECPAEMALMVQRQNPLALTGAQRQVLAGLARGLSQKEVASARGVSLRTVETHTLDLRRRLGARSIAHAVAIALKSGIIE